MRHRLQRDREQRVVLVHAGVQHRHHSGDVVSAGEGLTTQRKKDIEQ